MDRPCNLKDLDNFLKKVEDIESILDGLNSNDSNKVNESMRKADRLIKKTQEDEVDSEDEEMCKTVVNKSFINKSALSSSFAAGVDQQTTDQMAFMSAIEQDAKERQERRKQNYKQADKLKEKGNEEFRMENFEKALDFYTKAIQLVRDNPILYTNRAQCYLKLKKYDDVLKDCDWALRAKETWTKAFILKGRALTLMKRFDEALDQFNKAKYLEPKNSKLIESYVEEMKKCKTKCQPNISANDE